MIQFLHYMCMFFSVKQVIGLGEGAGANIIARFAVGECQMPDSITCSFVVLENNNVKFGFRLHTLGLLLLRI